MVTPARVPIVRGACGDAAVRSAGPLIAIAMLLQGASGNGPVQGVRLHDGREQRTAAVVLIISAEPLGAAPTVFAPGALPPTWAQRLRSLPSSASMLAVHLGFRGELNGLASVNHLHVDGRMLEVVLPSLADPPARRRGIARWS